MAKKKQAKKAVEVEDEVEVEKPVAKKQAKKPVDDEKPAPKKMTGYVYFCSHNREGIKADNPEMKAQDITGQLARLWKELTKEEQKEWTDSAADLE